MTLSFQLKVTLANLQCWHLKYNCGNKIWCCLECAALTLSMLSDTVSFLKQEVNYALYIYAADEFRAVMRSYRS